MKTVNICSEYFTYKRPWVMLFLLLITMFSSGISAEQGLVIRAGKCSADAFKQGSGVYVDGDYISGLSVNCTTATSNKIKYMDYLNGITQYTSYCVSTWDAITRVGGKLKADPVAGNNYHCLLAGKAKELAKKLTRYP